MRLNITLPDFVVHSLPYAPLNWAQTRMSSGHMDGKEASERVWHMELHWLLSQEQHQLAEGVLPPNTL